MAPQFFTIYKRFLKPVHDLLFFRIQRIWILRIHGWEIRVKQLIFLPVQDNRPFLIIDLVEQGTVFHVKRRLSSDDLPLHLKLDNRDCFMYAEIHLHLLGIRASGNFQPETGTRVVLIRPHSKRRQR